MHSNRAKFNIKPVGILHGTLLSHNSNTSCWLYTWELSNSSNKFAPNLTMKGISSFISPCIYSIYTVFRMRH